MVHDTISSRHILQSKVAKNEMVVGVVEMVLVAGGCGSRAAPGLVHLAPARAADCQSWERQSGDDMGDGEERVKSETDSRDLPVMAARAAGTGTSAVVAEVDEDLMISIGLVDGSERASDLR